MTSTSNVVKLTWQQGSGKRSGRWKKIYQGQTLYYDGGSGKEDRDAYGLATYRFWIDIAGDRRGPSAPIEDARWMGCV